MQTPDDLEVAQSDALDVIQAHLDSTEQNPTSDSNIFPENSPSLKKTDNRFVAPTEQSFSPSVCDFSPSEVYQQLTKLKRRVSNFVTEQKEYTETLKTVKSSLEEIVTNKNLEVDFDLVSSKLDVIEALEAAEFEQAREIFIEAELINKQIRRQFTVFDELDSSPDYQDYLDLKKDLRNWPSLSTTLIGFLIPLWGTQNLQTRTLKQKLRRTRKSLVHVPLSL
eukprot:TCONS_00000331-protein